MLSYKFKLALYDGSAHNANLVYEFKNFCYYMNIPRMEAQTPETVVLDVRRGVDFITPMKNYLDSPDYMSPIWADYRNYAGSNPRYTRPLVHGLFPYSFNAIGFNGTLRFIDEATGYYFVITDSITGNVSFRDNNGTEIASVGGFLITGGYNDARWFAYRGTVDGKINTGTTLYRINLNMGTHDATTQELNFSLEEQSQENLLTWFGGINPQPTYPIIQRDTDGALNIPFNVYDNNNNFFQQNVINIPTYEEEPDNVWSYAGNYGSYLSTEVMEINPFPMLGFSLLPSGEARSQWVNLISNYFSTLVVKGTYYAYYYKTQADETNYIKGDNSSWNNWGYGLNNDKVSCYLNNINIGKIPACLFMAKNNTDSSKAEMVFPVAQYLRNGIQPYTQIGYGLIQKNCVAPGNTNTSIYDNISPFLYNNNPDYPMGNGVLKAWLVEVLGWGTESGEEIPDSNDEGGSSGEGGGEGDFSDVSDDIEIGTPLIPDYAYGNLTVYKPTQAEFNSIIDRATDTSIITQLGKLFENDLSQILTGCFVIPVVPPTAGTKTVHLGNVLLEDVTATYTNSKTMRVNLGTLEVQKYWGSFLDYSPYTKVKIYLPFIGEQTLDTDEVMGKTLRLYYDIYVSTGNCVAKIQVGDSVKYQFSGNCACQIPVISKNNMANQAGAIGGAISTIAGIATMNPIAAASGTANLATSAMSIMSGKADIKRISNLSGDAGYLGTMTPYLSITRPIQSLADNFKHFNGYPSNIGGKVKDFSGYTEFDSINLKNIPATDEIKARLERKLKEGVYL